MKKISKSIFILLLITALMGIKGFAQNIGIYTSDPEYPLTVAPIGIDNAIAQKGGAVEIGLGANINSGGWLKTFTNHNLHFATNNSNSPSMTITTAGNVGIGLNGGLPVYKLDINGRIRIQNTDLNNQTAGFWLDGTSQPTRSFIGIINENYVGLWGNGGAGWSIAMNVNNGNTGFGTTDPTAKVDVNGSLRIRSASAKVGSIFVSEDNLGNGDWLAPVAFRAQGSSDGTNTTIAGATWTKLEFSPSTAYNAGTHYQPLASQFVAPVKGIYNFTAQATWINKRRAVGIGLGGSRNGVTLLTLPYIYFGNGRIPHSGSFYGADKANVSDFTADVKLEAGDIIWLIVYRNSSDDISADISKTWFTGRLITIY